MGFFSDIFKQVKSFAEDVQKEFKNFGSDAGANGTSEAIKTANKTNNLKCECCGAEMDIVDNYMICSYCGNKTIIDINQTKIDNIAKKINLKF